MNMTVVRKIDFCAGHRLLGHEGRCANLHGHNYVVELSVTGDGVDPLGRVVDFSVINRMFKDWIDENWDHSFLLWEDDRNAIDALEQVKPNRIFQLPYNPTTENIARYLLEIVGPELLSTIEGYDLQLTRVLVRENERSAAEASLGTASGKTESFSTECQSSA